MPAEGGRRVRRAIVLAGGDPVEPQLRKLLPDDALVVAADSGVHQAERLGLHVDLVVGDLDSADPAAVERARDAGAEVFAFPAEKDATDLELAVELARDRGAEHITLAGGAGARLDHFLANVALLASPSIAGIRVDAFLGDAYVAVARGGEAPIEIEGVVGSLVTLLPVDGDAGGVTTTGMQYPLQGETLRSGTSRGVSNVLVTERAAVELEAGSLLVIQPTGGVS